MENRSEAAVSAWTAVGRPRQMLALGLAVLLLGVASLVLTLGVGSAESSLIAGVPVPAKELAAINDAAKSCPALSPPKLAGQLMEASGFAAASAASGAGEGIAALSEPVWKRWTPWSGASRKDSQASIVALAHYMCDLVGQVRAADLDGDQWKLALAAHRSGIGAVRQAKDVPTSAVGYVEVVSGYAAWYALHPQFGGPGIPVAPSGQLDTPMSTVAAQTGALPDAYVPKVIAAGKVCDAFPPALVAAQLMAMSGFDPSYHDPSGAEGISLFLPQVWARYAPSASASPLDPNEAIPALGHAMCELIAQMRQFSGDPYVLALAAYLWGTDAFTQREDEPRVVPVQDFIRQVLLYAELFAQDSRLKAQSSTTPKPTVTPSLKTTAPSKPTSTGTVQPAPVPTSATAKPNPARTSGALVSAASGKCLGAATSLVGTRLQIWPCDGSMGQKWTMNSNGTITSVGFCMDAEGGSSANLTHIQIASCNTNPAQLFRVNSAEDLYSSFANKCVDVYDGQTANGSYVVLWPCTGTPNQTWYLR